MFTRVRVMNQKHGHCNYLHPSFVVLSGWCLQLHRAGWKAGCRCVIGIMWQTRISAAKQPLKRGEIERQGEVNKGEKESQAGIISAANSHWHWWERPEVTLSTSGGKKKKLQHQCMTEIHPKFNSRQQKQTNTAKNVRKTRKCLSGNLSVKKIKNILLYSSFGISVGVLRRVRWRPRECRVFTATLSKQLLWARHLTSKAQVHLLERLTGASTRESINMKSGVADENSTKHG